MLCGRREPSVTCSQRGLHRGTKKTGKRVFICFWAPFLVSRTRLSLTLFGLQEHPIFLYRGDLNIEWHTRGRRCAVLPEPLAWPRRPFCYPLKWKGNGCRDDTIIMLPILLMSFSLIRTGVSYSFLRKESFLSPGSAERFHSSAIFRTNRGCTSSFFFQEKEP